MAETVTVDVKLRAFVRKEKRGLWVAVCPAVGVASQGSTQSAARSAIEEAVQLWFESCIERGTLDRALQESNFRRLPAGTSIPSEAEEFVSLNRAPEHDDVLGDAFRIHVEIPAYQAAALLCTPA